MALFTNDSIAADCLFDLCNDFLLPHLQIWIINERTVLVMFLNERTNSVPFLSNFLLKFSKQFTKMWLGMWPSERVWSRIVFIYGQDHTLSIQSWKQWDSHSKQKSNLKIALSESCMAKFSIFITKSISFSSEKWTETIFAIFHNDDTILSIKRKPIFELILCLIDCHLRLRPKRNTNQSEN